MKPCILTINGGSSSIRFAVYEIGTTLTKQLDGKIERIALSGSSLIVNDTAENRQQSIPFPRTKHRVEDTLLDWLGTQPCCTSIQAVGHRVVHGMRHSEPKRITKQLLAELRRIGQYDPEHSPREIALIEAVSRRYPKLPQVACFDTAFHRTMPSVAKLLPLPRRYTDHGVERYGFHGLSFSYLVEELRRLDRRASQGRVILAHLGSGASLAAVREGKSIDTSMGFTPTAGLVMGTRSGDLDPGLLYYLAHSKKMTAARFQKMVNHESGLLGVSGTSSDIRDLCAREATDSRAADAVELFCYQTRKWIGSFAAALGGLDTLVFSAGIGENSPMIRERICRGLSHLGIELDRRRNLKNAILISPDSGRIKVRVIPTDEQLMIGKSVLRVLQLGGRERAKHA